MRDVTGDVLLAGRLPAAPDVTGDVLLAGDRPEVRRA